MKKIFTICLLTLLININSAPVHAASSPTPIPTPTLTQEQKEEERNNEAIAKEKDRASSDINRRVVDLNSHISKVSSDPDLTQNQKDALTNSINNEIDNLNELGTKIQNEDDLETIKNDRSEIRRLYSETSANVRRIRGILDDANEIIIEAIELEGVLARIQLVTVQTSNRDQDTTGIQSSITETQGKISDTISKTNNAIDIVLSFPLQNEDDQPLDTARQLLREANSTLNDAQRDARRITNDLIDQLRDYLRIP